MSEYGDKQPRRKSSRSLFGPVVLISVGVYFLMSNMGIVAEPNWGAIFQLWPLWLIFIGINIIVQSMPRPFGSFLSFVVGITAVAIFGYILFFGDDNPLLARLNVPSNLETIVEEISYRPEEIRSAHIELDLNSAGADIFALEDNNDLIAGSVSYTGDLIFDTSESGDQATVYLDTRSGDGFDFFNPSNWNTSAQLTQWQLGLNPNVEIDLKIDAASGTTSADLQALSLSYLDVDSASGRFDLTLPEGEYDVKYDAASGASTIVFPENGRYAVNLEGGSGHITLVIPEGMAVQVDVEDGSGRFSPDGRFELVDGERNDDGVWETDGFANATDQIELTLDVASGSVTIETP
ncbi:MAG: DUF4097 domain-containing protein [Chloroflexi bacterium]|nr:DUF4097 domain-containing protein [Chloroflexota bacterium]